MGDVILVVPVPVPSADEVAAAVRSSIAVELARLDVAVSTRTTPADIGPSAPYYGGRIG